jgi:hypothetical protein
MNERARIVILYIVSIAAIAAVALHAPIPQPAGYHQFADQRTLLGIANFYNVMSNLPFLIVGLIGIGEIAFRKPAGIVPRLRPAYLCLFIGIVLVAFGSGYYHHAPGDEALVWDRLPMTITFMALFAVVIGEHIDANAGLRLLVPLLVVGAASVLYWRMLGDLRPYVVVQFLPLLLVPLILLLYRSALTSVGYLWGLIGAYIVAKLLETADEAIFAWGQLVSGHTLKHLSAGLGMAILLVAITRRRPANTVATDAPASQPTAGAYQR